MSQSPYSTTTIPLETRWSTPWALYALLLVTGLLGIWEAHSRLSREYANTLRQRDSEMEWMSIGIESPFHAGIDQMRIAYARLATQGVTSKDFDLSPVNPDSKSADRLAVLNSILENKTLFSPHMVPMASIWNAEGRKIAGTAAPGLTEEKIRTAYATRTRTETETLQPYLCEPYFDARSGNWMVDALYISIHPKSGVRGCYAFRLRGDSLKHAGVAGRGNIDDISRAYIIHLPTLKVFSTASGRLSRLTPPAVGETIVAPPWLEAANTAIRTKGITANMKVAATQDTPPLLTRIGTHRAAHGYLVVVQSDEDAVLAEWRKERNLAIGFGSLMLVISIFVLRQESRRRHLRDQLRRAHTQLELKIAHENTMRELNAELEKRVELRTAELADANAGLADANRSLEAYARTVSHDLRAPLRAIDGYLGALVEDHAPELSPPANELIAKAKGKIGKMSQLIDAILRLARLSHHKISRERVDLSGICLEITEALREANPSRPVDFTIEPNCVVDADPTLVRIVLENLLANAWKYSSRTPAPKIAFGKQTRDGTTWYFVKDNGAGFDSAHAAALFKPFVRLHGAGEFEGNGIGLATVAQIIALHDGAITAEGAVGHGATFRFRL